MKKFLQGLGLFSILLAGGLFFLHPADAYVSVKGHFRSDGTYVSPHVRSEPNGLKYDNYGYKPSQGLYNDSYGTRGSKWDTPTWITDPDYYEGKSIYNSLHSNSVSEYSGSSYSAPKTTRCPANSTFDILFREGCVCNTGYGKSLNKNYCIKLPEHSHAVESTTDVWLCDEGYKEVANTCVPIYTEAEKEKIKQEIRQQIEQKAQSNTAEISTAVPVQTTAEGIGFFSKIKSWFSGIF